MVDDALRPFGKMLLNVIVFPQVGICSIWF